MMDAKLAKVYYSPQGYWKGLAAVKKLASAAKVSEDTAVNKIKYQTIGMGIAFSFIFGGIHGMDYFRKSVFTL